MQSEIKLTYLSWSTMIKSRSFPIFFLTSHGSNFGEVLPVTIFVPVGKDWYRRYNLT